MLECDATTEVKFGKCQIWRDFSCRRIPSRRLDLVADPCLKDLEAPELLVHLGLIHGPRISSYLISIINLGEYNLGQYPDDESGQVECQHHREESTSPIGPCQTCDNDDPLTAGNKEQTSPQRTRYIVCFATAPDLTPPCVLRPFSATSPPHVSPRPAQH